MKLNVLTNVLAVLGAFKTEQDVFSSTMQEIVDLVIEDPAGGPFLLSAAGNEYYVSFTHGDEDNKETLPLSSSGDHLRGIVNLHVEVDKHAPLKAEIYHKQTFFNDRKVASVEFAADTLDTGEKRSQISGRILNSKGKQTDSTLVLNLIQKNWKDVYGNHKADKNRKNPDFYFSVASKVLSESVSKTHNPTASELSPPTQERNPNLPMTSFLEGLLTFPDDGEFASVDRSMKWKMAAMTQIPFTDVNTQYENRADGVFEMRKILKNVLPEPPEGRWLNPTRDDAMKRVFFSSLGMHLTRKIEGVDQGFVADTRDLTTYKGVSYKYRPDYEPYGCRTYFDNFGNINKIVDGDDRSSTTYRPGDAYWEWAKLKSRSSAFVKVSLMHLVDAHYRWGNVPGAAMRMFLGKDHPVRRAFSVHFFKTAYTCARARYSLFDKGGILSRGLSYEYQGGLEKVFMDMLRDFRFTKFPDDIKERGLEDCNFHVCATDGMDLYKIAHTYVSEFLDEVYPDEAHLQEDVEMKQCWDHMTYTFKGMPQEFTLDNLKEVWGEIIFRVTGYHSSGTYRTRRSSVSFSLCV